MRLYYFTSLRHGLAAIRDQRLKISQFSQLNDPADHVGIVVNRADERYARQEQRDMLEKTGGIICMSGTWKHPLMWGHYADNYKGVCLAFEVNDAWCKQVNYVETRPTLTSFGRDKFSELTPEDFQRLGTMKSAAWSYEDEWRRFIPMDGENECYEYDFVDDLHFQKFDQEMYFIGALFGYRAQINAKQMTRLLDTTNNAKFCFTRHSETRFDVIIDQERTQKEIRNERRLKYDLTKNIVT